MKRLKAADLFCGAGGFTTGATAAGVDVILAVNHWRTAIQTHQANHPSVRHICARIEHIDARNDATLPPIDLLMASPECTHHSIARGGRPVSDQKRQQPFALLDWIDAKHPQWVLVENVREFRDWGPLTNAGTDRKPHWRPDPKRKGETFRAWLSAIESCGYQVDHQLLNAADYGAATKRVRLFVLARRGRSRRDIPWPEPTHAGRWTPAHTIIDWSRPLPSIFARKRPLAENTLIRLEKGLRDEVEPFIVYLRNNCSTVDIGDPLPTITTSGAHHALAVPFQFKAMGRNPGLTKPIDEPMPTIVAARENHALAVAFLSQYHNGQHGANRNYPPSQPIPTIDTQNRYGLAVPYLLAVNHGGSDGRSHSPAEPLATLTTKTGHSLVVPFLAKYYGTGTSQNVSEALDTITTKDRFSLATAWLFGDSLPPDVCGDVSPAMASLLRTMRELGVFDLGFRMLEPHELSAAQGFPKDYLIFGSKADQVRQIGNAVCPPVARAICETLTEAA